ncbi:MAG TPA: GNAT family N-acetyltransferase [Gaiellaceae bacterium]|nr:GNAT family N-acetyltransferase [Gaiellaceae bacterium]
MIRSRDYEPGDLRSMLGLVSELWPHGRHGIGYAFMAQRLPHDDWEARLWFDGDSLVGWGWSTGWRIPRGLSYELRSGYETLLDDLLEWAQPDVTTAKSGDARSVDTLHAHGFAHDPEAPWIRWNSRSLDEIEEPRVPDGYRLATMADHDDFASRSAAHRSAFAPSRFTDEVYETVRREAPWRAHLDCVVIDPEGDVAAYALAWIDERNSVGELEPVGVRAEEQRRGLGRAVCLHALHRLRAYGAETALVGSRGDDAYPGPRALYESIGFRELWRDLVFARQVTAPATPSG